jgi:hemolysin type calcium-binding protein
VGSAADVHRNLRRRGGLVQDVASMAGSAVHAGSFRRHAGRAALVALLAVTLAMVGPPRAEAAVYRVVAGSGDSADANPADLNCANLIGQCTLRAAIQTANQNPGADTINVDVGTYQIGVVGSDDNVAATGDLDILDEVTINGGGGAVTVSGGGATRVFHVGNSTLHLNGVTVTGGGGGGVARGAGILVENAGLDLMNSQVKGNNAAFIPVIAPNASGGGIEQIGGGLRIVRSTISGNSAGNDTNAVGRGGGIFASGAQVTIEDSTIAFNSAGRGMGANGSGAGLLNESGGSATLTNVTISGNQAGGSGGDGLGGGILTQFGAQTGLRSVTVNGNGAGGGGGPNSKGGNLATGIADGSATRLKDTIVAGGTTPTSPGTENCSGPFVSDGNNLEDRDQCGLSADNKDIPSRGAGLKALASNGGPTQTHGLNSSSPAIDAGSNECPAKDQRGIVRPQGDGCEIGAFEFRPTAPSGKAFRCYGRRATIVGTNADNTLKGTNGADVIVARGGDDTVNGGGGKDLICGEGGKDILRGASGADQLSGGTKNDTLRGGSGNDLLQGGGGADKLFGEAGRDRLSGGAGGDLMVGGPGKDKFNGGGGNNRVRR